MRSDAKAAHQMAICDWVKTDGSQFEPLTRELRFQPQERAILKKLLSTNLRSHTQFTTPHFS